MSDNDVIIGSSLAASAGRVAALSPTAGDTSLSRSFSDTLRYRETWKNNSAGTGVVRRPIRRSISDGEASQASVMKGGDEMIKITIFLQLRIRK